MLCLQVQGKMSDAIHIWRAALDEEGWPGPERLPAEERERATAIVRGEASRRWVAARWALRRVLGEYLGVAPTAIELELGEHGKPRLRGGEGPEFSLSHSQGLALVAVAERPLGIDVEALQPGRNVVAVAERALPEEDAAAVRAADAATRQVVFYAAWTRHEARFKCLGTVAGLQ
jgi:4'-phosphopantetheinyl transferase